MKLEEYTADAICRAMTLPSFIEESWATSNDPVMRIVLRPSFHPEICITVSCVAGEARWTVDSLRRMLWLEKSCCILPSDRAEFGLPAIVFDEVVSLFNAMRTAFDPNRRIVMCDGMMAETCLVSRVGVERIDIQVMEQFGVAAFIRRILELTWPGCEEPHTANAVAQAASYVGLKFPLKELPVEPEVTRLMILGAEQERHDYFEILRRRKEALKQSSNQTKPPIP